MQTYQVPIQGIEFINGHNVPTGSFVFRVNAESEGEAIAKAVALFKSDENNNKFIDYKINKVSTFLNLWTDI